MLLREHRRNVRRVRAFLSEAKVLIVTFYGVAWDLLTNLCTLHEFMAGGDVRTLLQRFHDVEVCPRGFDRDKVRIALHVVHALAYVHALASAPVLHRDLKSKHILLDTELNAKLTQIGVPRERLDCSLTSGAGGHVALDCAGSYAWQAAVSDRADVVSFGVVLSELDMQELPYASARTSADVDTNNSSGDRTSSNSKDSRTSLPDTKILEMVACGTLQVAFSGNASVELVALARACVALDPEARPSAMELVHTLQLVLQHLDD